MRGILFLAALLAPLTALADLDRCIDATCRVTMSTGTSGTGCVYHRTTEAVYVLTNAHVADATGGSCEFWHRGYQSAKLPARRVYRNSQIDAAVLAVPVSAFQGRLPPAMPFHTAGRLRPGSTVTSVGCSRGAWPTAWKGHKIRYEGQNFSFVPAPAGGRSGSAVFDERGEYIVGLLHSRAGDNSHGYATAGDVVLTALTHQTSGTVLPEGNQTGVVTPVPIYRDPTAGYRLLPYRYRQENGADGGWRLLPYRQGQGQGGCPPGGCPPNQQPPQGGAPYPDLPPPQQPELGPIPYSSPSISIDVGPIADAIRGPPEERELKQRQAEAEIAAAEAQARYYGGLAREAEDAEQREMIGGMPGEAPEAIGQAVTGDFSGAADTALSEPMLGWLGQILVYVLVGVFGITGLPALLIRFGVPFALKVIGGRLRAAFHTEADDVADEIADRAAKKVAENGRKK